MSGVAPALGMTGGALAGSALGAPGMMIGSEIGGQLGQGFVPEMPMAPNPPVEPLMKPNFSNIPNEPLATPNVGGSSAPQGNLAASLAPAAMRLGLPMNAGQNVALQRLLQLFGGMGGMA